MLRMCRRTEQGGLSFLLKGCCLCDYVQGPAAYDTYKIKRFPLLRP